MSQKIHRRNFLERLTLALTTAIATPISGITDSMRVSHPPKKEKMNPILNIKPLGFQWETADPFLFCVHHEDYFPEGNEFMGPNKSHLQNRHLGDDFIIKDGFRMYHGKKVPGFPGHPHRGFETITVVRKGLVDHADSLGAAGRYGNGDVQWMTAGKGVQHSEMFPLLKSNEPNPLELFQIWLNLPSKSKMVEPHFKMLWKEDIPNYVHSDSKELKTNIEVIVGNLYGQVAPTPPPDSWAANSKNEVAIWNLKMQANATFKLPKASEGVNRTLYFYEGNKITIGTETVGKFRAIEVLGSVEIEIVAGNEGASILVLQGKPIGEQVMQYGPFVMNTKEEISQAFEDYHRTQFGGWPWPKYDQVHAKEKPRFAKHADGRLEEKVI